MKQRKVKIIAAFFITLIVWDIVFPATAFALTGGPSQPEVQSFEPVGTTEMVDVFSGDFVYNIPLLDVEGFPINISYHSGVGMDDEASWVGLGWNINPGVVNRNMRGIPDDFKGNQVKSTTNIQKNETYGLTLTPSFEIFGKRLKSINKDNNYQAVPGVKLEVPSIDVSLGVFYNNYRGLGYEFSIGTALKAFDKEKGHHIGGLGLNLTANSFEGADVGVNAYFNDKLKKSHDWTPALSGSLNINSRKGLSNLSFNYAASKHSEKLKRSAHNYGRSAGFQLNPTSYTPQLVHELTSTSINLGVQLGPEVFGYHFKAGISGYYHGQFLKNQVKNSNAYGYLYSHDAQYDGGNVMFDLNRENDGNYTKGKPFLPMPVYTYDYFSISGEGTGGSVRPFRSDVGVMYDAEVKNTTLGLGLSAELGGGNIIKNGLDISGNYGYTKSGPWKGKKHDFDIIRHLGFEIPQSGSQFEPFYFKSAGEKTLANNDIFSTMNGNEPTRIEVSNDASGRLGSKLVGKSGGVSNIYNKVKFSNRQARNMAVNMLSNYEADKMGLDRKIKLYKQNTFELLTTRQLEANDTIDREVSQWDLKNLMSEMTVTNPDGRRYVYGIPAYNQFQSDASFRVVNVGNPASLSKNPSTGLVGYNAGDNSTSNSKGDDNFFNKNELPAYAHSFLLSSVLSSDYVDITGNGVSDDDIGTAVKINYSRTHTNYKWRTPYGKGTRQANYDEGLKSDKYDDRGNYIYGEKEIWYVHSIESKNYVACFYTSRRADACQVKDEDGGRDTSASFYKLDSIKLFTKEELLINGINATPLKTVHFEYDYSLCLNVENNRSYDPTSSAVQEATGKLTLKKIYFTYGKSKKGRTNSYQFNYSDYNPTYNLRGYDRWGNFKPNATVSECNDIANPSARLSNADDPYVLQNKDSADLYSSAWSLTQIKLPSGGTINVNYEADDYAYIQDRQAGQMFKVCGINNSNTFNTNGNSLFIGDNNNLYLFFDLEQPFSKTVSPSQFAQKNNDYFAGIDKLYFKFLMDLTGDGDYEFVTGYTDKHEVGFSSKNPSDLNYDVGYVKLKEVPLKDKRGPGINPIAKASWNFMRLYAPKKLAKVFSNYEMAPGDTKGALKSLAGSFVEMANMYRSFGRTMRAKGAGQKFVLNKSMIRLNNPVKQKLGGGARVKKLTLSDSWDEMVSGQEASTYGQEYLYTKEEKQSDGTNRTISSGVAAWEPGIGNDENSLKQPVNYEGSNALAPDDQFMIETPIGEAFFPAPNVGYSSVTTVNIKPTNNITRTATGKVVNEFYTAYDFPVIFRNTDIDKQPKRNQPRFLGSLLKVYVKDKMFVSQGYSVELNDMHGKPKAQWVYEENNKVPISGVKYEYHYSKNQYGKNQLANTVDIVNHDGSITSGELGRETDYMFDTRNNYSYHSSATLEANLDAFMASIFPVLVPSLFSSISISELEFGSAVNTKVITRYGILKSTEVFENGASVKTHNVLFDATTGDVLLSKTTNEFTDTIYTFNYPAHFAYDGMGQAYKNLGYWFKNITITNGEIHGINNYQDYFSPGDEVYIEYEKTGGGTTENGIMPQRLWAVEHPHYPGDFVFLTRTGYPFSTDLAEAGKTFKYNLKIIRSGRRNMQSASIGSVVSLVNPISGGTLVFDSVINSGAVEFSDMWAVEHKNVFEELDEIGAPYTGVGPAPNTSSVSRGACNDSCYNEVYDLLLSFGQGGLFKTLLNANTGDTINLMKSPYRNAFLCAIDQTAYCPQFDFFHTLGDSLIIYDSETNYSACDYESDREILYASATPFKNGYQSFSDMTAQRGPSAHIDLNFRYWPPITENKSVITGVTNLANDSYDVCDKIRTRSDYKKRKFRLKNGCFVYVIVQCIPPTSNINIPKATPITCNLATFGYQTTIKSFRQDVDGEINSMYGCDKAIVYTDRECPYPRFGEAGHYGPKLGDGTGGPIIIDTLDDGTIKICSDSACDDSPYLLPINPYVYGTSGNWKPKKSWLFYDKRNQASTSNIRRDGTYTNYANFWKKPVMGQQFWDTGVSLSSKWTFNTEVTKFNRTGNEVENKDALDIYSSALFGYGNSIVKAVGNNSRLRQLAYDGMEDYKYFMPPTENHFSFSQYTSSLDSTISHSGVFSLKLDSASQASVRKCVIYAEKETANPVTDTSVNLVMLNPTEILDQFSPDSGKYIVSAWVNEQTSSPQVGNYTDTLIVKIYQQSCKTTYKFTPSGPIIEGWQRIEGQFNVPDTATCIEVILKSNSQRKAYFDDIRIHPWNANMKSFVYHPRTLRLVATLDENNYATFYEYDDEGRLVRIKRETERGIVTLQESRTGLKIND